MVNNLKNPKAIHKVVFEIDVFYTIKRMQYGETFHISHLLMLASYFGFDQTKLYMFTKE